MSSSKDSTRGAVVSLVRSEACMAGDVTATTCRPALSTKASLSIARNVVFTLDPMFVRPLMASRSAAVRLTVYSTSAGVLCSTPHPSA